MDGSGCSESDCDQPVRCRGLCARHYNRQYEQRRADLPEHVPVRKGTAPAVCSVEGCGVKHAARGYCDAHYRRLLRNGSPHADGRPRGAANHRWRGGIRITSDGYVEQRVEPGDSLRSMADVRGYVRQHRLVMARALGRPLRPDESVHHVNGDRGDNRVENLQLRTSNHGPGVALRCRSCGSHDIETEALP